MRQVASQHARTMTGCCSHILSLERKHHGQEISPAPAHPERICWGCDKYCPADSLQCGNGSGRTQHPAEVLGEDWYEYGDWGLEVEPEQKSLTLPEKD
jgi:hypothetical protein